MVLADTAVYSYCLCYSLTQCTGTTPITSWDCSVLVLTQAFAETAVCRLYPHCLLRWQCSVATCTTGWDCCVLALLILLAMTAVYCCNSCYDFKLYTIKMYRIIKIYSSKQAFQCWLKCENMHKRTDRTQRTKPECKMIRCLNKT